MQRNIRHLFDNGNDHVYFNLLNSYMASCCFTSVVVIALSAPSILWPSLGLNPDPAQHIALATLCGGQ